LRSLSIVSREKRPSSAIGVALSICSGAGPRAWAQDPESPGVWYVYDPRATARAPPCGSPAESRRPRGGKRENSPWSRAPRMTWCLLKNIAQAGLSGPLRTMESTGHAGNRCAAAHPSGSRARTNYGPAGPRNAGDFTPRRLVPAWPSSATNRSLPKSSRAPKPFFLPGETGGLVCQPPHPDPPLYLLALLKRSRFLQVIPIGAEYCRPSRPRG